MFCRTMTHRATAAAEQMSGHRPNVEELVRTLERTLADRDRARARSAQVGFAEQQRLQAWDEVLSARIRVTRALLDVCDSHIAYALSLSREITAHPDGGSPMRWHHRRKYRKAVEELEKRASMMDEEHAELTDGLPELRRCLGLPGSDG
ncbi:hypothetical protein [Pseudonocardia adelaidensis]|uniref:hypothetical protein n=1 Tax=Pseudonocardia adelaidensis TaxID=648754 RepID=UPI0031E5A33B